MAELRQIPGAAARLERGRFLNTGGCLRGCGWLPGGIWLHGWLLAFAANRYESRPKLDLYHECLVIWMLSYAMTNVLWEIPG